jgi:hypothetical protein
VGVSGELERLGPTGFQDLAASLAVAHFGPGVQVMGAWRDGGRDLYFRGSLIWQMSKDMPADVWDGVGKHRPEDRVVLLGRTWVHSRKAVA